MPSWLIPALVLAGLVLAGLVLARRRHRRGRRRRVVEIPAPDPGWDGAAATRRLIERNPELRTLVEGLGFSPGLERRTADLIARLRAQVRVEIPDFDAFERALDRVEDQIRNPPANEPEPLRRARVAKRDDPLLGAVLTARSDRQRVLELLARDPVDALLPFIEQIPFCRDDKVIWRTPIELAVVRKRPADPADFTARLDQLERRVREAPIRRESRRTDDLLDAITRARRGAARPDGFLPTALRALESELTGWLAAAPAAARERRRRLVALVESLLETRWRFRLDTLSDVPALGGAALDELRRRMQRAAQSYVREPWMHGPWLTGLVLAGLLVSELAGRNPREWAGRSSSPPGAPAETLAQVLREVASGCFDGEETIHRLRQLERRGCPVHSLVFALLRIDRPTLERPAADRARGGPTGLARPRRALSGERG